MTKSKIAEFEIHYTQFLDPQGNLTEPLPPFATNEHLIHLYSEMVKNRIFDTKAISLQRTGKLGTYPSTLGQEAIGVGVGSAMQAKDVLCPYYRDFGAQFLRGVKMIEILQYWGGDEHGSNFQNQRQDFPICVPIASQTLHAVGIATALKLKKEPGAVVAMIGDGGTSRGDFYEAMNLAGVWQLPVVFVINNNQWAISVARKDQTAAETLAQKGIAAGLACEQIDGNDVIAVEYSVRNALTKAREQRQASVIEAMTYRLSDHTTADDAKRYRDEAELNQYQTSDPILRCQAYLVKQGIWDENKEKALKLATSEEVALVIQEYLHLPMKKPETMFDHLYGNLPLSLLKEREEVSKLVLHEDTHG